MPRAETLLIFGGTALVLIAIPGPSTIYLLTRTLSEGRRSGFASAFGVETGDLIHVVAAAIGLSAVLASSAFAFDLMKYAGAAYLIYLGIRTLVDRIDVDVQAATRVSSYGRLYGQGVLIHLLNPKVSLFFLAVVPQFVDPERGSVGVQVLVLGAVFIAVGLAVDIAYVLGAGALRSWLIVRPIVLRRQRQLAGGIYIALGIGAALSGANQQKS